MIFYNIIGAHKRLKPPIALSTDIVAEPLEMNNIWYDPEYMHKYGVQRRKNSKHGQIRLISGEYKFYTTISDLDSP